MDTGDVIAGVNYTTEWFDSQEEVLYGIHEQLKKFSVPKAAPEQGRLCLVESLKRSFSYLKWPQGKMDSYFALDNSFKTLLSINSKVPRAI